MLTASVLSQRTSPSLLPRTTALTEVITYLNVSFFSLLNGIKVIFLKVMEKPMHIFVVNVKQNMFKFF